MKGTTVFGEKLKMNDEEESTFLGNRANQPFSDHPSVEDVDSSIRDIENGPSHSGQMARLKIVFKTQFCSILT
jgi:hypothetical protein